MTVPETKIYPRKGDNTIVYLKNVVKNPAIEVGDYTFYNDRRPALHNCRRRPRKTHPQALFGQKISALLQSEWWNLAPDEIANLIPSIQRGDLSALPTKT